MLKPVFCDYIEGALGDLEGHRGLCDDLEGWDGEVGQEGGSRAGGGTYVYSWLIPVVVWQKPTQYCKAIILQLKINTFKNKDMES